MRKCRVASDDRRTMPGGNQSDAAKDFRAGRDLGDLRRQIACRCELHDMIAMRVACITIERCWRIVSRFYWRRLLSVMKTNFHLPGGLTNYDLMIGIERPDQTCDSGHEPGSTARQPDKTQKRCDAPLNRVTRHAGHKPHNSRVGQVLPQLSGRSTGLLKPRGKCAHRP